MKNILLLIVFVEVVFGAFSMFLAEEKNRRGGSWFLLGFLFNLVALITIAGLPVKEIPGKVFTCNRCKFEVKESDNFCPNCGDKFNEE